MDRKLLPLLLLLLAANTPVLAQDPQAVQRHRQRMLELFHRLDHDNDGRLYLQEAGLHPSMRNLDRDGDGVLLLRDITPPGAPSSVSACSRPFAAQTATVMACSARLNRRFCLA